MVKVICFKVVLLLKWFGEKVLGFIIVRIEFILVNFFNFVVKNVKIIGKGLVIFVVFIIK